MLCPKCGMYLKDSFTICPSCGTPVGSGPTPPPSPYATKETYETTDTFNAASSTTSDAQGAANAAPIPPNSAAAEPLQTKSRVTAGVLGILLGGLGIHKFYLGYTTEGLIMLGVWLLGFLFASIPSWGVWIVGLVEGIIYLTKSDAEFNDIYIVHRREWF